MTNNIHIRLDTLEEAKEQLIKFRTANLQVFLYLVVSKGVYYIENNEPAIRTWERIIWKGYPRNFKPEKIRV